MAKKSNSAPEASASESVPATPATPTKKVAIRFAEAVSCVDGSWAAGDVASFEPAVAACYVKSGRAKLV